MEAELKLEAARATAQTLISIYEEGRRDRFGYVEITYQME